MASYIPLPDTFTSPSRSINVVIAISKYRVRARAEYNQLHSTKAAQEQGGDELWPLPELDVFSWSLTPRHKLTVFVLTVIKTKSVAC